MNAINPTEVPMSLPLYLFLVDHFVNSAAFERPVIPDCGVVRRAHTAGGMRPPHALHSGRLDALGATQTYEMVH